MITHYLANQLLRDFLSGYPNGTSLATNQSIYIGLSTTTPNADGTGITEPNKNGYARVLIGRYNQSDTHKMSTPASGSMYNTTSIYFPEVTTSTDAQGWGTCTYAILFDSLTGGHALAYSQLTNAITPNSGTIPIIRTGTGTGDLVVTLQ